MNNPDAMSPRRTGWRPLSFPLSYSADQSDEPPFVIGIIADLAGHVEQERPRLLERKFRRLHADNLDECMAQAKPRLRLEVADRVTPFDAGASMAVELRFASLDDFRPEGVAWQIPQLARLLQQRSQLAPLIVKLEIQPQLGRELKAYLDDPAVVAGWAAAAADDRKAAEELVARAPRGWPAALSFRGAGSPS
jgi:type VI secretion system protein ImpB